MFSQNKNKFVLISTLKIIVLFKTNEREFKPKRDQAWSHICVVLVDNVYSRTKFKFPPAVTFYPPVAMTGAKGQKE